MVTPYNIEKLVNDIRIELSKHSIYSKNIKSVLLDPTEKRDLSIVHIDVNTNLSDREDCRGLGEILKDIEENYRNQVEIHFHQYSSRNFN